MLVYYQSSLLNAEFRLSTHPRSRAHATRAALAADQRLFAGVSMSARPSPSTSWKLGSSGTW
jgi:hypothetical protein